MGYIIARIFDTFLTTTIILTLLVGVCWLFDSKPENLYFLWKLGIKGTLVSFLFFILFGRKNY